MLTKLLSTLALLVGLFCYALQPLHAQSHGILGGELTYTCIAPNTYQVTLNVINDCQATPLPDSLTVNWAGNCPSMTTGSFILNKNPNATIDISNVFPNGSPCNGGTGTYGFQSLFYTDTLTLSNTCSTIELSWEACCYSDSLQNIQNPATAPVRFYTTLDNSLAVCNNSPVFLNPPLSSSCTNSTAFFNHGVVDVDGDSLFYSLVDCQSTNGTAVNYNNGFSTANPLGANTPINIDSLTGALTFSTPSPQSGVICVLVKEKRMGVIIGETVRTIAIFSFNCPINNVPTITGMDSSMVYDTTITVGQTLCFKVYTDDLDSADIVTLSANLTSFPNATFTIDTSGTYPIGTFCWTPTIADTGIHVLNVIAMDNNSPFMGTTVRSFNIIVNLPLATTVIPLEQSFKIFPNPAHNYVALDLQEWTTSLTHLAIFDALGQEVHRQVIPNNQTISTINISHLNAGYYTITLLNEQGQHQAHQQLMIH